MSSLSVLPSLPPSLLQIVEYLEAEKEKKKNLTKVIPYAHTKLAYADTKCSHSLCSYHVPYSHSLCRYLFYAVSGTDISYAAPPVALPTRCPVLTERMALTSAYALPTMSGTDIAYGATKEEKLKIKEEREKVRSQPRRREIKGVQPLSSYKLYGRSRASVFLLSSTASHRRPAFNLHMT
eukprot:1616354-Rhodomonas_salina.2